MNKVIKDEHEINKFLRRNEDHPKGSRGEREWGLEVGVESNGNLGKASRRTRRNQPSKRLGLGLGVADRGATRASALMNVDSRYSSIESKASWLGTVRGWR